MRGLGVPIPFIPSASADGPQPSAEASTLYGQR
jgi:hypothetical protein